MNECHQNGEPGGGGVERKKGRKYVEDKKGLN